MNIYKLSVHRLIFGLYCATALLSFTILFYSHTRISDLEFLLARGSHHTSEEQIMISDNENKYMLSFFSSSARTTNAHRVTVPEDVIMLKPRILQEHITVSVPNLAEAKEWYSLALPIVEIPRGIRTAVKGAWFEFIDLPSLNVHLLEKKPITLQEDEGGDGSIADVTGQHIGLDLGKHVGVIREDLYHKGIPATLAAVSSTVKTNASSGGGIEQEQQAIFVTGGQVTWEFTHLHSPKGPLKLIPSNVSLSASKVNIPLKQSMVSSTANMNAADPKYGKENHFKFSISSGNPLATAAGHVCLQAGGSAADAAIAAAAVMSVVEPYNGGLGGDFVAMVHNPANRHRGSFEVLNGSGRAPLNAVPLPSNMRHVPKIGVNSILSLPGAPAAWCRLHARYGKMPWKLILQPAIMMASEGFLVSERTAQVWEAAAMNVMDYDMSDRSKEEFLRMFAPPTGENDERMSPRAGERYYNPTLAFTFQRFADGGCEWFYNEAVDEILDHVEERGGLLKKEPVKKEQAQHRRMTATDLASWEEPISTNYTKGNDIYEVFAPSGNSQAGSALLILNMMNKINANLTVSTQSPREHLVHHQINAKRVVYRDTLRKFTYDQAMIDSETYVEQSVQEIQQAFRNSASVNVEGVREESHDTEGLVVRDSNGLALSILQSIAVPFGSGIVVPSLGIPLHGRGYGFDTESSSQFSYLPGNRPWTTLSPFMVNKNDRFWMAASVKGGDRQPYAFTQIFLNIVHLGYSPADAVSLPRFRDNTHHHANTTVEFDVPPYLPIGMSPDINSENKLHDYLNENGFKCKKLVPKTIEDSGFGVAQILIDNTRYAHLDSNGKSNAVVLTSISDLGRKPGLAITGEQPSLVNEELDSFSSKVTKPLLTSPRDIEHIVEPVRNFIKHHLHPLTSRELDRLAKEGLGDTAEIERVMKDNDKLRPLRIAIDSEPKDDDNDVRVLRHMTLFAQATNKYKYKMFQTSVHDINVSLPKDCDVFFFQPGDYPIVSMKSYIFPVGKLPLIGVDSYFNGLRERNPELNRMIQPLVPENVATWYDSREPRVKAGVLKYHSSLSNENKSEDTGISEMAIERTKSAVRPGDMPLVTPRFMKENDLPMLNYPVVLKREGQLAGNGITISNNVSEFVQDARSRYNANEDFFIQEALKGKDEYTMHFIGHYGRLLAVECFESKFDHTKEDKIHIKGTVDKPINKGQGFKGCTEERDTIKMVETIVRGTLYNGFGCVQYKRNPDSGLIGIIEMNPRTCGGLFSVKKRASYGTKITRMIRKWIEVNEINPIL